MYLNALLGARTIDGDNDNININNNNDVEDDSDAGERETISFFDQSVFSLSSYVKFCFRLKYLLLIRVFEFSLLREEGEMDVFLSRRSVSDDSESDDSEDLDDDDDVDDDLLYLT